MYDIDQVATSSLLAFIVKPAVEHVSFIQLILQAITNQEANYSAKIAHPVAAECNME